MIRKFFTTVAAGSLFVGGIAAANLALAQPAPNGPGMRGGSGGMMMMADANKDGKITRAEFTAGIDARFARMDANKDGKLTSEDRGQLRAQRLEARFAKLDADRNGQISKSEFMSGHEARGAGKGERGKARWGGGRRGHGGMGMHADADRDGVLTKAEFAARPLAMFDRMDANKDGTVTQEEVKAARDARRSAWGDRKGKSTPPAN